MGISSYSFFKLPSSGRHVAQEKGQDHVKEGQGDKEQGT
jgi:hypothetical protein